MKKFDRAVRADCVRRSARAPLVQRAGSQTPGSADESRAAVRGCHSERAVGGLSLASFDLAQATERADVSEKMIRKLRAGVMPPPGARRPDEQTLLALAGALSIADRAAAIAPNPGRRPFQAAQPRGILARSRLLALDVDVSGLPPTPSARGSTTSPTRRRCRRRCSKAPARASKVTALAIGDAEAESTKERTTAPKRRRSCARRGRAARRARRHRRRPYVSADGDYAFRIELHGNADGFLFGGPARASRSSSRSAAAQARSTSIRTWRRSRRA